MLPTVSFLITFLVGALSVGGVLYAAFQPQLARSAMGRRRLRLALGDRRSAAAALAGGDDKRRKRSVENTLREIEEKQKAQARSRSRQTLVSRLRQGGLDWSRSAYWSVCAATGAAIYLLVWVGAGLGPLATMACTALGALLLPHAYVGFRRRHRLKEFSAQFPNAVDVIVRGVRSGMPLGDCIRVVAAEGSEPVRSEFKVVVDDQTIGVPIQEAVQRLADRVPLPETNFLSTVITIQSRTGGNLTEALGNLSTVLRERKKMAAKIKAMSAEAKASGGIIGSLPPIVAFLLYLTSPEYISLLFTTTAGNVVLVGSGIWMLIGILVMRKMINFDF